MSEASYAIHDLARLTVRARARSAAAAFLARQLAAFRVPRLERGADITIDIHDDVAAPSTVVCRTASALVTETGVFWHGAYKLGQWRVHLDGLREGPLRVTFAGNAYASRYLFFLVLEPILDYVLSTRGMTLLHASGVGDGDAAVAFSAMSGVGKTSLALLLLNQGLPQFLGDEFLILSSQGVVHSFPIPIGLYRRNLIAVPSMRRRLSGSARARLAGSWLLGSLTHSAIRPMLPADIAMIHPHVRVPRALPLASLCHLLPAESSELTVRTTPSAAVVDRLMAVNDVEFHPVRRVLADFAAVHFDSAVAGFAKRSRGVLAQATATTTCYEVLVPPRQSLEETRGIEALRPLFATAAAAAVRAS